MVDLLLHELRTPVAIAQGYLRMLTQDRLPDPHDRQRALAQSMEALGRIGDLCGSAGEYMNAEAPLEVADYPAAEFVRMLQAECHGRPFSVHVHDATIPGHIRAITLPQATAAVGAVLQAALRGDPALTQALHIGVHGTDLIVTTGDEVARERLVLPTAHHPFNPWRGGTGLLVPLALRRLAHMNLRLWALSDTSGAVAIAMPLELA